MLAAFTTVLPADAQQQERRLLVLYPDSDIPAASSISEGIGKTLASRSARKLQTFHDLLDLSRVRDDAQRQRGVRTLSETYADTNLDAVVALGPDAPRIAAARRAQLAPGVPIAFCCTSLNPLSALERPADIRGVVSEFDVTRTVEIAQLQPTTPHLVVVAGANTAVLFGNATLWENHRNTVLEAIATFVGLMVVVAVLLVQILRRRKAEAHLKQSEERLNFAAASAGLGLWHYDVASNRLWCSEHCRSLFGVPPHGPLHAAMLVAKVHPEDRHGAALSMRAVTHGALAGGVSEFRVLRPNGELRWVQVSGQRAVGDGGTPIRVSGIFRDITAYKQAQLEAKELSKRVLSIQDEERQRIARELHDSTAQHLAAISLNLLALQGARGAKAAALCSDMQSLLDQAMNEVRSFSYLLYPQELANGDLIATLARYIQGFSKRTGLDVTLRASNIGDELPDTLQQSLLRIIQESLANVHRHASASRATVNLKRLANRLHVVITDDGCGLTGKKQGNGGVLPTGVGIAGMTARARQFGGKLDIRSRSARTIVHAVLPIDIGRGPPLAIDHAYS